MPFNSNAIAKALALTALRSKLENERDPFDTDTVFTNKRLLMDTIMQADKHGTPRMAIAQTASSTPIMTLYYTGKEAHFDLQAHLIKFGILAVSCKTYMGLNERAVRLMLPPERGDAGAFRGDGKSNPGASRIGCRNGVPLRWDAIVLHWTTDASEI